jgi:hypothetical protein
VINEYRAICFCERDGIGPHWRTACTEPAQAADERAAADHDPVNHPSHYTWLPGIEVIDITEGLNFCMGNAVKYLLRADHKGRPLEDLAKARWYIDRELQRRERDAAGPERDGAGT